jgi:hypothetical protein
VAVTVVLLSATAVLGESYTQLRRTELGYRPAALSFYELSLSPRVGVAIGIVGAIALQRLTAGFVYDTLIDTPTRLALTGLGILLLTLVACGAPALAAGRTDPARLLRE